MSDTSMEGDERMFKVTKIVERLRLHKLSLTGEVVTKNLLSEPLAGDEVTKLEQTD